MGSLENRGNTLGDVRAENDHAMLDTAFYDWQDYKILFEAEDRFLVVGRRGTGKSALTYRLQKEWREKKSFVVVIAPDEEDVFGLRAAASRYGSTLTRIRAAVKTGWRYALIMEIADKLEQYYKTQKEVVSSPLNLPLKRWRALGSNVISRLRKTLNEKIVPDEAPEDSISELASRLDVNNLGIALEQILQSTAKKVMVLVDRLDEGYESDDIGIGIVDGIIYGSDELKNRSSNVRTILFLRDNIFRSIQEMDQDFTRNVEGSVLRLHWDIQELFYLVCRRIKKALNLEIENNLKVWNHVTANELHGKEGFKTCLKLTLYRPRDLISLLNTAFYNARKQGRQTLIIADIEASSKHISEIRFDDLRKEYSSVFPGILEITRVIGSHGPTLQIDRVRELIAEITTNTKDYATHQHLKILGSPDEVIKSLYGIGFLGLRDSTTENILFSYDGKKSDQVFSDSAVLFVHPCYWGALGLTQETFDQNAAERIFDEYEITISSQVKEQRDQMIGRLISELGNIELGQDHASEFEDWCKRSLEFIIARKLTNMQLKPNGNASARRDLVGTNMATEGFWQRIREDYSSRQVVFEIKNFEKLGVDEYRQCASYLGNEYGRLGFIVCRDSQKELSKGAELDAFQEYYSKQKQLIIKLTASFLVGLLSKLRSPQKFDTIDDSLSKHLDSHIRLYANGQGGIPRKKRQGKK